MGRTNVRCSGEGEINPQKKLRNPAGTRTGDLPITSRTLLSLSYWTHKRGAEASLLIAELYVRPILTQYGLSIYIHDY